MIEIDPARQREAFQSPPARLPELSGTTAKARLRGSPSYLARPPKPACMTPRATWHDRPSWPVSHQKLFRAAAKPFPQRAPAYPPASPTLSGQLSTPGGKTRNPGAQVPKPSSAAPQHLIRHRHLPPAVKAARVRNSASNSLFFGHCGYPHHNAHPTLPVYLKYFVKNQINSILNS